MKKIRNLRGPIETEEVKAVSPRISFFIHYFHAHKLPHFVLNQKTMRKFKTLKILVTMMVVISLASGCEFSEKKELDPIIGNKKAPSQESLALIPIARMVGDAPQLIKSQEYYLGFFRKNYHENDPSQLRFHSGTQGVRLVKDYNNRENEYQWRLAVEAYSERQAAEIFMKLELVQDGNILYLPNVDQNAFHIYFCDLEEGHSDCRLRVDAETNSVGCYQPGSDKKCPNLLHRHLGI